MKGAGLDLLRAGIWLLIISMIILFSTGGFSEFIYRGF
ncbi:hypothetical protein ASZ90_018528 [hydrocarbon metagenome]|uniref:Uncharacterized protein n=1 Tax=hydrocarbon metagenome TaxID=938273 RepID=A0A0W8E644_9ZZZZ